MIEYKLGRLAGLDLSARPSAIAGTILLWGILSAIGVALLDLPIGTAIAAALAAVALHWISEFLHNLGHARAARRAGYPMLGVRAWGVLSASIYPPDEPALPGAIHIQRALGGPLASLLVTLVAGGLALALRPLGGAIWWVALFFFLDNLLVFTLGALLPLGFNDGSTLLHWRGK
jgi:Zn-dependent protease